MNLGERLRHYRRTNNLSQKELADKLGCTKSSISMYENNQRQPRLDMLSEMARLFRVDMNTLLEWKAQEDPHCELSEDERDQLADLARKQLTP